MLNANQVGELSKHAVTHQIGYCNCPCFDMLKQIGKALAEEGALRAKLARVSPEALAAITVGAGQIEDEDGDPG